MQDWVPVGWAVGAVAVHVTVGVCEWSVLQVGVGTPDSDRLCTWVGDTDGLSEAVRDLDRVRDAGALKVQVRLRVGARSKDSVRLSVGVEDGLGSAVRVHVGPFEAEPVGVQDFVTDGLTPSVVDRVGLGVPLRLAERVKVSVGLGAGPVTVLDLLWLRVD